MSLQEYMKAQKEAKESTLPKLNERKIDDDGSGFKVVRKEFEGADDVVFRQYDGKVRNPPACSPLVNSRANVFSASGLVFLTFVSSLAEKEP